MKMKELKKTLHVKFHFIDGYYYDVAICLRY